jgi:hypothetical protein
MLRLIAKLGFRLRWGVQMSEWDLPFLERGQRKIDNRDK